MITLNSTLSGTYLSSEVPDIAFAITSAKALVTVSVDGSAIYDETLYPVSGQIALRDLLGLFNPYAKSRLTMAVTVDITEQSSNGDYVSGASMSFTVVYSAAETGQLASDFVATHFLTLLDGEKITARGRLEYLHYIGTDDASCLAYYGDGSTATFTPTKVGGNDGYTTIDVSPALFLTEGKTLTGYTITAGGRTQDFVMDLQEPDCAPVLIFANSFGCDELVYCTGTHKVAPKYDRSNSYIEGLNRNYQIVESRVFTADTGVLNFPMANWLDDLFRSEDVRLVNFVGGEPVVGKQIIVTDSKSEYTNDDDSLPRFEITYQYAQRNQNIMDPKRAGRIFDNTFDFTFN